MKADSCTPIIVLGLDEVSSDAMTKERKAWIPPIPTVDDADHKKRFEEALESGYAAIRRSRVKTEELREEYRTKAAAAD